MKNFLKFLFDVIESLGRAKAATALARVHKYEEARQVMLVK